MYIIHCKKDIKSIYAFIPQNASLVDELAETMDCITKIEKDIKNNGWSQDSVARCKKLVTESLILRHERQRKVGSYILGYLERELSLLNEGDVHNASSDPIESTFGVTKDRMSNDKLTGVTPMILIMPLRIALADKNRRVGFDFKERLEEGRHRHIKEWTNANLSPNLAVKRINTIGKKCVGF